MKTKVMSRIMVLTLVLSLLLGACTSTRLADDFDQTAVEARAEEIITLLNARDTEALREQCTVLMRDALTDDVMAKVYKTLDESGAFEKIESLKVSGSKDKDSGEEFAVISAKAKYEIRSFSFTISLTKQDKVAGLYVR